MVLFGIDVSHHNAEGGLPDVFWSRAKAAGITYMLAKCTEGLGFNDPSFANNYHRAERAGIIPGAYHYVIDGASPTGQAAHFLARIRSAGVGDLTGTLLMSDTERGSGRVADADAFHAAMGQRAPGHPLINYLPRWYWEKVGGGHLLGPVMASHYTGTTGTPQQIYRHVPAEWWTSYGGADVAFLQFTDQAQVAGRRVDASAYAGTLDQLHALAGTRTTPPPAVPEDDMTPEDLLGHKVHTLGPDGKPLTIGQEIDEGYKYSRDAKALAGRSLAASLAILDALGKMQAGVPIDVDAITARVKADIAADLADPTQ